MFIYNVIPYLMLSWMIIYEYLTLSIWLGHTTEVQPLGQAPPVSREFKGVSERTWVIWVQQYGMFRKNGANKHTLKLSSQQQFLGFHQPNKETWGLHQANTHTHTYVYIYMHKLTFHWWNDVGNQPALHKQTKIWIEHSPSKPRGLKDLTQ